MDANIGIRGEPFLSQAYEKISQQLIITQPKSALAGESGNVSNSSLDEYNLFSLEQDINLDLYVEWNIIDATRRHQSKANGN